MPYFPFEQRHVERIAKSRVTSRRALLSALIGVVASMSQGVCSAGADELKPAGKVGAPFPPAAVDYFEAKVRPILVDHCLKCHGPKKQSSGLRLDSREAVLKGGESGPAVVLEKPDESLLIQAIAHTHAELKMPPASKLADPTIAILRQWVALGAPWSVNSGQSLAGSGDERCRPGSSESTLGFSTRPLQRSARGEQPAMGLYTRRRLRPRPARGRRLDPVTTGRQTHIDSPGHNGSVGNPPDRRRGRRVCNVTNHLTHSPQLVDRLLASPRYGERWGRHWLDVARYADTKGYVFTQDRRYPYAYTYRDYVINALNDDLGL